MANMIPAPQWKPPELGFIRLERQLPPDYRVVVMLPARENGVGAPTGGEPMPVYLEPGEAVGPILWSDCKHIENVGPAGCVYAPVDEHATKAAGHAVFLTARQENKMLEGLVVGEGRADRWIHAYAGVVMPPAMTSMKSAGQTVNTRKAPGATFPAFESWSAWTDNDKRLFITLSQTGRVCLVTKEVGSDNWDEWRADAKAFKSAVEKMKKSFTVPPDDNPQTWLEPHVAMFWQAYTREDTRMIQHAAK